MNKDYVRIGNQNLENMFVSEDVTEKIQEILMDIDAKREEALAVAQQTNSEGIPHCYKPKDCSLSRFMPSGTSRVFVL